MNEPHWISAVFSPTGGTAAVAKAVTGGMGQVVDLSRPVPETPVPDNAVLLAAVPVFGGRIPAVALERLAALKGSGPAVALAVYGNRAWEDVLSLDLCLDSDRQVQPLLDRAVNTRPSRCAGFDGLGTGLERLAEEMGAVRDL